MSPAPAGDAAGGAVRGRAGLCPPERRAGGSARGVSLVLPLAEVFKNTGSSSELSAALGECPCWRLNTGRAARCGTRGEIEMNARARGGRAGWGHVWAPVHPPASPN